MAEEEGKVQCPLCPRVYSSGKVTVEHLYKYHKGDPKLGEALKSVPKDKCPYCRQPKSLLAEQKRRCKRRPEAHPQRVAVAAVQEESEMEMEGKIECRKCTLCPEGQFEYKTAKALRNHIYIRHKGDPRQPEALKAVQMDVCCYCGQPRANLVLHHKVCRSRPPTEAHVQQVPQQQPPPPQVVELLAEIKEKQDRQQELLEEIKEQRQQPQQQQRHRHFNKYEGASNKEMVEEFEKRMRERQNNSENTVKMYSTVLEGIFKVEETWNLEFKAFWWWRLREDDRLVLRPVDEYLNAMGKGIGHETQNRICFVYNQLHKWIYEEG